MSLPSASVVSVASEPAKAVSLAAGSVSAVGGANQNIFAKIGRLNEALRAINPNYRPLGFSITSIESCSASVLEDAVQATETAVSTLMSVIGEIGCSLSRFGTG